MQTIRPQRFHPVSRPTILHDTLDFTEEPHSLPHSPSTASQLLHGRLPGSASRRPTRLGTGDTCYGVGLPPTPSPYVAYMTGNNDDLQQRKWTQEDQDQYDEKARRRAMNELVSSWMDRLQLISVITTFFAAMEAQLIGVTTPDNRDSDSPVDQAANAALAGALVVHVFAAILSFFAAFFLIRYKLSVAKREEHKIEVGMKNRNGSGNGNGAETLSSSSVWSTNPHLEQVGPFRRGRPPTHLLDHCHSLCMWLSAIGFVLALTGVLCFVWSRLALSAGVFASVCMGACIVSGIGAVFWPASSVHRNTKAS